MNLPAPNESRSDKPPPSGKVQVDDLERRLRGRLSGRVRGLRLELRGDGVVLQGSADTYYAKQLAQHALMDTSDLPILANEILVCVGKSLDSSLSS